MIFWIDPGSEYHVFDDFDHDFHSGLIPYSRHLLTRGIVLIINNNFHDIRNLLKVSGWLIDINVPSASSVGLIFSGLSNDIIHNCLKIAQPLA